VLTRRGWVVVATALVVAAAGLAFGTRALEQLGVALVALPIIATAVVRLSRHDLGTTRAVTPQRTGATMPVNVSIEIVNHGSGPAPLILLEDRLPAGLGSSARFTLAGVEPGGEREVEFVLRPPRRGRYEVGPLWINVVDPFGLAQLRSQAVPASTFLAHPRAERLSAPRAHGERRSAASPIRQLSGARGEDFYTLREYVEGDDLRKIHWASTAKRDRYMIRQEETPWQARATIVLDDRRRAHDGVGASSSFEHAVEAAASLVDLYARSGYGFRLVGATSQGLPSTKGSAHRNRCMDLLATIELSSTTDEALAARLAELEASSSLEATLVLVAGTLTPRDGAALTRCARRWRQIIAISYPAHRFGSGTTKSRWAGEKQAMDVAESLTRSGARVLVLGPDESFPAAWGALWSSKPETRGAWGPRPEFV
jgi:uncharacterized protein (DUF58 family)